MRLWYLTPVVFAIAGCGSDPKCGPTQRCLFDDDAGVVDSGISDSGVTDGAIVEAFVEVGTGADRYDTIADNQLMPFIQGPQGGGRYEGYHFWGGIRVKDFDPMNATIRLIYMRADNREEFAHQERILPLQGAGGGYFVAWGFAPRIRDCCEVLATEVIMRAEITDRDGKSGFDEVQVVSEGSCIDILSGLSVCP